MTEPLVGLEDVVIATSTICYIDGDKGILRYRGYDVNELAEKSTYEEVAYLLLNGQHLTILQQPWCLHSQPCVHKGSNNLPPFDDVVLELRRLIHQRVPKHCLAVAHKLISSMNCYTYLASRSKGRPYASLNAMMHPGANPSI